MIGYLVLQFVRYLYGLFNSILMGTVGFSFYSGKADDRQRFFTNYTTSAHVTRVLLKSRLHGLEAAHHKQFLLRHVRYTHPDIVLRQSNVSLMRLDPRYASFAVCKRSPLVHSNGPLMAHNQYRDITHLIRIPLKFFIRLASEESSKIPSDLNLILLSNLGRCGSTLLTKMFEDMPKTVAVSEPEVLADLHHNRLFDNFNQDERDTLLRCCVTMLYHAAVKTKPGETVDCMIVKSVGHAAGIAADFARCFPRAKHMYMYRHPTEYLRSVRSVFFSVFHPIFRTLALVLSYQENNIESFASRQFPVMSKEAMQANVHWQKSREMFQALDNTYESIFSGLFASNLMTIKYLIEVHGIDFHPVSYHDLKEDPQGEMFKIRRFCRIDQARQCNLPERDTQANSGLSRENLDPYKIDLTPAEVSKLDLALLTSGFPVSGDFPVRANQFKELISFQL